jgi:hypothetical protein
VNASFENPVLSQGGLAGVLPGWTASGAGGGTIFFPDPSQANHAPDGNNVVATGTISAGSIFQDLGVAVVSGHQYELDVFVGTRKDGFVSHYLVELLAGATTFASRSGIPTPDGSFFEIKFSGIGSGSGDLGVRLGDTGGGQTLFDNVRVFDTTPPSTGGVIPEPSTFVLSSILFGMFGMVWSYRRLRQTAMAA